MEYRRCEQCGSRGTDDNPTFEMDGQIWCAKRVLKGD